MARPAIQLPRYQHKWLLDKSRFKCGIFARQTGKTFTTTLDIVDDAFQAIAEGRRSPWIILSRGERQAKEALEEGVKRHARAYELGIESFDSTWRSESGVDYRMFEVELPGGTRIGALPANPDTARGFSRNAYLDEFAFHADSRRIWGALFPVVSNGWKLRITSTPNGKGNKFYEIATGEDTIWSRHSVDIYQAVADGLPRNIDELRRALNDQELWEQEYELKYLDESTAWLTYDLINAAEDDEAGLPDAYQGGDVYLGVDIAARRDLFVIYVLERVGDVLWERELVAERGLSFALQDELLDSMFKRYRVRQCFMDRTGMGEKPVEDAQRRYGESRVHGVLFTPANKQHLATVAKQVFEDRRLRIKRGDAALRSDLHAIKRESGPTGNIRFVAARDANGHADRAWALFLALAAADGGASTIEYQSAGPRDRFDGNAFGVPAARFSQRGFGTIAGTFEG
jgi:phage FluMu gp28-like protein